MPFRVFHGLGLAFIGSSTGRTDHGRCITGHWLSPLHLPHTRSVRPGGEVPCCPISLSAESHVMLRMLAPPRLASSSDNLTSNKVIFTTVNTTYRHEACRDICPNNILLHPTSIAQAKRHKDATTHLPASLPGAKMAYSILRFARPQVSLRLLVFARSHTMPFRNPH